ncbi:hypothetical protein FNW52_06685 [Flavobacterium sp. ZT3R18]|uniref:hypothetical protein n=1 Tax=Flavobacterium sp. ZT3R18 TaxID=2594429 RepID=UPI0011798A2A|nr:hypothetical protein [Flavobacterium sp. ZT3R18]TRX36919.1 hypothetical protein FNW52_06685 [Flavobacterium sp. ZT3R18]
MTTITITLNERSKAGKAFMEIANFFKDSKAIEMVENDVEFKKSTAKVSENIPNIETVKAMEDAEENVNLISVKSKSDFYKKMRA